MINPKSIKPVLPEWILGKTIPENQILEEHLYEVASVIEDLLTDSLYDGRLNQLATLLKIKEDEVLSLIIYLTLMHDIGKVHPLYQKSLHNDNVPDEFKDDREILHAYRHEIGSARIAKRIWTRDNLFDSRIRNAFAGILRLHHQGKKGTDYENSKEWTKLQEMLESSIRARYPLPNIKDLDDFALDTACNLITGLIIFADWIASGHGEAPARKYLAPKKIIKKKSFEGMFGFKPRRFQKKIIDHFEKMDMLPLFLLIEAPMGEGKTEIALYLAEILSNYWKKNGVYMGMPTTATANQMVERARALYGETDLIHSSAWLEKKKDSSSDQDEFDYAEKQAWESPKKRGLLSRYAVGTVDQIMKIGLLVRYGVLRLVGMTNKVIIIDEVHAYDVYMQTIIERVLEWCMALRIPVIMLSATLPAASKRKLFGIEPSLAYPLVTSVYEDGRVDQFEFSSNDVWKKKNIKLNFSSAFPTEFKDGITVIIVNTIKTAQKIYSMIPDDVNKTLFHSEFTNAMRRKIEQEVLDVAGKTDRPEKHVIVMTQVGELSLNYDADYMFVELSPIDSFFQRIGRYHRWDLPDRPTNDSSVTIVYNNKSSEYVYYPYILSKTKEALERRSEINIPEDITTMVNEVYDAAPDQDDIDRFIKMQTDIDYKQSEATSRLYPAPKRRGFGLSNCMSGEMQADDDAWASQATRLGADRVTLYIIPERLYDKLDINEDENKAIATFDLAKEIYKYGVPTRMNKDLKDDLRGTGLLEGSVILKAESGDLPTDDLKSGKYTISHKLGLIRNGKTIC